MKKLLALLLALSLVLSLGGCAEQLQSLFSDNNATYETLVPGKTDATDQTTVADTSETTEQTAAPETEPENSLPPQTDPVYQPDPDRELPPQTDPRPTVSTQTDPPEATSPAQTDPAETTAPAQTDPPEAETTLPPQTEPVETEPEQYLDPNGSYTSKDDVALYIHLYNRLPNNFITKDEAEDLYNWSGGSLSKYGKCIGGDRFYNREGQLPGGYTYYECDIGTLYSSSRGAKRLVFTYTGIIYYTSDHYKTFTRLY